MSIYAFSIDNFSRDEEEVAELMRLAKTRLMELCEHGWVYFLCSLKVLEERLDAGRLV